MAPFILPEGALLPKNSVTVSATGTHGLANGIPNMGADFGPDTLLNTSSLGTYGPSYSTTSGINEAIKYLTSGGRTGGRILLDPNGAYSIAGQIGVPSNISIESKMGGGEAGAPLSLVPPSGSINFGGSTGPAIQFLPGTAGSALRGVAVTSTTAGATGLVQLSGCKDVSLVDCFIKNTAGIGLQVDGLGGSTAPTEKCNITRLFVMGNPAIQIGAPTGTETVHARNCLWEDVTAEGVNFATGSAGYILIARYGYYHTFVNFACRSTGAQIHLQNDAVLVFQGGEFVANAAATVLLQVDGGEVVFDNATLTIGTTNVASGTLRLRRVIAGISASLAIALSGTGVLDIDRDCSLPAAAVTLTQAGAGSASYLPSGARAVGPMPAIPAGAIGLPGNRTASLIANPPAFGAINANNTGSRLTIMIPVNLVPGAAAGGVQGQIGPTVALGIALPAINSPGAVAGVIYRYDIIVPAGWFWQINAIAGAPLLGLALAFGEASD